MGRDVLDVETSPVCLSGGHSNPNQLVVPAPRIMEELLPFEYYHTIVYNIHIDHFYSPLCKDGGSTIKGILVVPSRVEDVLGLTPAMVKYDQRYTRGLT